MVCHQIKQKEYKSKLWLLVSIGTQTSPGPPGGPGAGGGTGQAAVGQQSQPLPCPSAVCQPCWGQDAGRATPVFLHHLCVVSPKHSLIIHPDIHLIDVLGGSYLLPSVSGQHCPLLTFGVVVKTLQAKSCNFRMQCTFSPSLVADFADCFS